MKVYSLCVAVLLICINCSIWRTCYSDCTNVGEDKVCDNWALSGECDRNTEWMLDNCFLSCTKCTQTECYNKEDNENCDYWSSIGECDNNKEWMRSNCALSCIYCTPQDVVFSTTEPEYITRKYSKECRDQQNSLNCSEWFQSGECKINAAWMWTNCYKTCSRCDCINLHQNDTECREWHGSGNCSGENQNWMWANCYRECSLCEGVKVTDIAWFIIAIGDTSVGKITIGLFGDVVPVTTANFLALVNSTYGFGYKGSIFHRIVKGFVVQGGDITQHNGYGGRSIYGGTFKDENFLLDHYGKGWLNMANVGVDSNESQFAVLTAKTDWLDGKHVVFGKIIEGYDVVQKMESITTSGDDVPLVECKIVDTGSMHILYEKEVEKNDVIGDGEYCLNSHISDEDCDVWDGNGDCFTGLYSDWMWSNCYKSCSQCHSTFTATRSITVPTIPYNSNRVEASDKRECSNSEDNSLCEELSTNGACETEPNMMHKTCYKACSKCESQELCHNGHSSDIECLDWALAGDCISENPFAQDWMWENCYASCSKCQCVNKHGNETECLFWEQIGECDSAANSNWMWQNCWASCSKCKDVIVSIDSLECMNRFNDDLSCAAWAATGDCDSGDFTHWMKVNCFYSCSNCTSYRDLDSVSSHASTSSDLIFSTDMMHISQNPESVYTKMNTLTKAVTGMGVTKSSAHEITDVNVVTKLEPSPSTDHVAILTRSSDYTITTDSYFKEDDENNYGCRNIYNDGLCLSMLDGSQNCENMTIGVKADMYYNCYKACTNCENTGANGFSETGNPLVTDIAFFDVFIDNKEAGRIFVGLFGKIVPLTSLNFLLIATEAFGKSYIGTTFYNVSSSLILGGDIRSFESIYGNRFPQENFVLNHYGPGWVGMSVDDKKMSGSQFYITVDNINNINGRNVVFGKVVGGMTAVKEISSVETNSQNRPTKTIEIRDSGRIPLSNPFMVTKEGVYL